MFVVYLIHTNIYIYISICKRVGLQSLYHINTHPTAAQVTVTEIQAVVPEAMLPRLEGWGPGKVDFPAKKPWKMMKNAASHWFPLAYSALVTYEYLYNREYARTNYQHPTYTQKFCHHAPSILLSRGIMYILLAFHRPWTNSIQLATTWLAAFLACAIRTHVAFLTWWINGRTALRS